jgi:hypothetical protein
MTHSRKPFSPEDKTLLELAERRRLHNAEDRIKPILESFSLSATPARQT